MNFTNNTMPADLTGVFSVPDTESTTTTLQQLYLTHYSTIREAVSDSGPNLFVQDVDRITAGIADHISNFTGEPEEFLPWAVSLARESAESASAFIAMRSEHSGTVRKAIGSILKGCGGLGVHDTTIDEIETDLWLKVLEELPAWLAPGYSNDPSRNAATLDTRLFAKALWRARAWKTTRVREKERYAEAESVDLPSEICGRRVECPVDC
jgi:hypothetical protein